MKFIYSVLALSLVFILSGCAATKYDKEQETAAFLEKQSAGAHDVIAEFDKEQVEAKKATELPVRFRNPAFLLDGDEMLESAGEIAIPVGADISSVVPLPLRDIMKKLAKFHNMNISWASDVRQDLLVDVQIRAEDDFYDALEDLLRQLDYHHEVEGQTLVIQNKMTKKFHIAIPAISTLYSNALGGDVLGGTLDETGSMLKGGISLDNTSSGGRVVDVWENIKDNLDNLLNIWKPEKTEFVATIGSRSVERSEQEQGYTELEKSKKTEVDSGSQIQQRKTGEGYYIIDQNIGLITVSAPASIMEQVTAYLDSLKVELYRQVSIEAKIIEVTLSADNRTGIDWQKLLEQTAELANGFEFNMDFQKVNPFYHNFGTQNKFLTVNSKSFELFLDAMKQQGHVEVLSNPRLNVMNGQPAMLSIGTTVRFIENVSVDVDSDTGVRTYTAEPGSVMSGVSMGIVANIVGDEEVFLNLTPVTSSLEQDPIETITFGDGGVIGLPRVKIREMNTNMRVKNGEMLVIGGLIDSRMSYDEDKVAGLGDAAGKLFKTSGDQLMRSELVIILRPVIHTL